MPNADRRAPLPGLTALRFFAASYVLLYHTFPLSGADQAHPSFAQRLNAMGFTGVSCFFVLSGFILAYTHPAVPSPRRFFRARFARVYPLYLLAFLLTLPNFLRTVLHEGPRWQLWAVPADLLLVQNWIPPIALAVNTPAWTLSCEAFFYLLFPWLVRGHWLRSGRTVPRIVLLWVLALLPAVVSAAVLVPARPQLARLLASVLFLPPFRLPEFVAGMALGFSFLDRQTRTAGKLPTPASPWLPVSSTVVCVAALWIGFRMPHEVVRNGLMLGPFCLLIWALARRCPRLLASRPLQLGGEISYGVYLLQLPVSHLSYFVLRRLPLGPLQGRVRGLLVFPVAWVTYVLVEKPCRRWLLGREARDDSKPIPTPQPELP